MANGHGNTHTTHADDHAHTHDHAHDHDHSHDHDIEGDDDGDNTSPIESPCCSAYDHRHAAPLPMDPDQLSEAAQMFQALSDPARLKLLLDLAEGERCVSELVFSQQAKLSSVSSRLKVLYAARLVNRRRDAKHIYYSLADDHVLVLLRNVLAHSAEPF